MVEIARHRPRFALFWDPGTCKTATILAVQRERPRRTLVLAQKSVLNSAWSEDGEMMQTPVVVAHHSNRAKRLKLICTPCEIVIATNYETFRSHERDFMEGGFTRLVVDESSKCKNRDSKTTKAITRFADTMEEVYILSGTPAPNCPTEYWAQLRIVSPNAVGRDFFRWAHYWMIPEMQTIYRGGRQKKVISGWTIKEGMAERFAKSIADWAWSLTESECLDLPAMVNKRYDLDLSAAERKAYKQIEEEFCVEINASAVDIDGTEINSEPIAVSISAEATFMKLRQVPGGYVRVADQVAYLGNTKTNALVDIAEDLGRGEPLLIWAEFTAEIDAITAAMRGIGRTVGVLDGRTKRPKEVIDAFVNRESNVIVAHPKSAGHGTDGLQRVCRHSVYYSYSFSSDEHWQSKKRLHRNRQKFPPVYHYLCATGTVDETALRVLNGKITRSSAMLAEVRRIHGKMV